MSFLEPFWRQSCADPDGTRKPPAECAGCLDSEFAKNSLHTFSHALLPQRGAADSIEAPQGGSTAAPLFILGLFAVVCRRMESLLSRRNVRNISVWGSYGGSSAGSRRFSVDSRRGCNGLLVILVLARIGLIFSEFWRP